MMSCAACFGCRTEATAEKYQKSESKSKTKDKTGAMGLNLEDAEIIQKDWELIENRENIGQVIFMRIFDQKPDIKSAFKLDVFARDDLYDHPKFISHSQNFSKFLNGVVQHLGDKEQLLGQTSVVSNIHTNKARTEPKVLDEENWNTFYESALVCIMDAPRSKPLEVDAKKRRLEIAWRMLMARLVNEIKYSL